MAVLELLIKSSDNAIPGLKDKQSSKQGMIFDAKPEGYQWGTAELNAKLFVRCKIDDNEFDPAWIEPLYDEGELIYKRGYVLKFNKFLTSGEIDDLKAGLMTVQPTPIPYLNNASGKVEEFDYDTREEEFGIDWH